VVTKQSNFSAGCLVMIHPGVYLTEIGSDIKAQVLLTDPTCGVVLEDLLDRKIIMLEGKKHVRIFASESNIEIL